MAHQVGFSSRCNELLVPNKVSDLVLGKLDVLEVQDLADFQGLGARERDLGEFASLLGLEAGTPEESLATKMAARQVWRECKSALANVTAKKGAVKTDKKDDSGAESSDGEPDVNVRRTPLGEFRNLLRFNLPMCHQASDRFRKKMAKSHSGRLLPYFDLFGRTSKPLTYAM